MTDDETRMQTCWPRWRLGTALRTPTGSSRTLPLTSVRFDLAPPLRVRRGHGRHLVAAAWWT